MTAQSCRLPSLIEAKPELEFAAIMYAGNGTITLSIVADGKPMMFSMNRRRLMLFLETGFETLKDMEPGS
jgi:hypothetical protein